MLRILKEGMANLIKKKKAKCHFHVKYNWVNIPKNNVEINLKLFNQKLPPLRVAVTVLCLGTYNSNIYVLC